MNPQTPGRGNRQGNLLILHPPRNSEGPGFPYREFPPGAGMPLGQGHKVGGRYVLTGSGNPVSLISPDWTQSAGDWRWALSEVVPGEGRRRIPLANVDGSSIQHGGISPGHLLAGVPGPEIGGKKPALRCPSGRIYPKEDFTRLTAMEITAGLWCGPGPVHRLRGLRRGLLAENRGIVEENGSLTGGR